MLTDTEIVKQSRTLKIDEFSKVGLLEITQTGLLILF